MSLFTPACAPVPEPLPREAQWFAFHRGELVVAMDAREGTVSLPATLDALGTAPVRVQSLGTLDGVPAYSAELPPDAVLPVGLRTENLRALVALVDGGTWAAAAYGFQIQYWDRTTQFCGACGNRTVPRDTERARRCTVCRHEYFPRVSPCTITLVHDGDRILMTRQATWPAGRYGLVAGFVEPGESLEECARREIREETMVEVTDMAYQGSQPWPFPHQIMVGFTARYVRGEVVPRAGELEDARWFTVDALPVLPPRFSIARALIDRWVTTRG